MVEVAQSTPQSVCLALGDRTSKFAPAAPGWDDFVPGAENRLAAAAVARLLDEPPAAGQEPHPLLPNPLLLYGPSGTGKTHLTRCVVNGWSASLPPEAVVCQTASDLVGEYGQAVQQKDLGSFWAKYRKLRLWVLEDLDQLQHKPTTQRVVVRLADRLLAHGGIWLVSAQLPPWKLTGLNENLRGRLSFGLCLPLVHPARSTRLEILHKLLKIHHFRLPADALPLLAEALPTVRELLGAARFLDTAARLEQRQMTVEDVRNFLCDRLPERAYKVSQVAAVVARHFGLKVAELKSASRTQTLAHARSLAMYLSREMTECSLNQIGRYFGRRDHTTVLHSCRKIADALPHNAELLQEIAELRRRISPSTARED